MFLFHGLLGHTVKQINIKVWLEQNIEYKYARYIKCRVSRKRNFAKMLFNISPTFAFFAKIISVNEAKEMRNFLKKTTIFRQISHEFSETKNSPFFLRKAKNAKISAKNLFSRKRNHFPIWLETLMRCMEGMRAVKLNLLEEYWKNTPALIFINCPWIIIRCNIQGAPEYMDTGCIRIQGHRVYQDTGIQGVPGYRDTGCTRIQGYRDKGCTRIHGYRVYQDTWIQGVPE